MLISHHATKVVDPISTPYQFVGETGSEVCQFAVDVQRVPSNLVSLARNLCFHPLPPVK
jgi:hypothetical protein